MEDRFRFRSFGKSFLMLLGIQNLYSFEEAENGYYNVKVDKGWLAYVPKSDLIIMQCTGMRDINDKLIYESDILKDEDGTYKIIYHKDLCQYIALSIEHNYCKDIIDLHSPEIIGNIYEKEGEVK